jgi:hypothetical protein
MGIASMERVTARPDGSERPARNRLARTTAMSKDIVRTESASATHTTQARTAPFANVQMVALVPGSVSILPAFATRAGLAPIVQCVVVQTIALGVVFAATRHASVRSDGQTLIVESPSAPMHAQAMASVTISRALVKLGTRDLTALCASALGRVMKISTATMGNALASRASLANFVTSKSALISATRTGTVWMVNATADRAGQGRTAHKRCALEIAPLTESASTVPAIVRRATDPMTARC